MKTNSFVSLKKSSVKVAMLVLAASALGATEASAAMFKLLGAANLTSKAYDSTGLAGATFTGKFAFGGGAAVVLGSGTAALELGANYLTRNFTIEQPGASSANKYSMVNIPVMLRLNLGRVVSVGVGGYANLAMGNFTEESGGVTSTTPVKDTLKSTEFGAVASLGFDIPMGASTGLVIDGRYTMALAEALNDATVAGGNSWKPSDIQAFVGLRFGASK